VLGLLTECARDAGRQGVKFCTREGVNHGQSRQARPGSKEAEKGQGQAGAREITVRTPSGDGPKHAACARDRTPKLESMRD
jgi:hypothetical protein